ncbi:biotin/lipoyl-binding protein [uncultured Umboniibacter sp.]|uniref:HlyD family secretion protein n=1 Tax=uncultured Umboniibacter sp. TaxID=1798917 RepID=UPI002631F0DC|nr:biotin/lipoyl-binding protein [uncultured Umboniibacter sp.]
MDLLLILTYAAFCSAIFKIFKIPLTKWTVPTAVLGGIVLIGSLIVLMNYNHPFSENSRTYFVTNPVIPVVKGRVIDVPVEPNVTVEQGDVLFKIDPQPYEFRIASLEARLIKARDDLERAETLVRSGSASARSVDAARASVDDLTAQHAAAKYDLEHTVVRAPSRGHVTQLALRPGMMAVNLPLSPAMTFVNEESHYLVGWYRQNSALRISEGYEAEVAFDSVPGTVFTGEVVQVLGAMAEGQISPSSSLISSRTSNVPGRIAVIIEITDERYEQYRGQLPGGAYAQTAIYSPHFTHVAIMRKILLRMASWMNYLFPFH